jgi:hypothetical protein
VHFPKIEGDPVSAPRDDEVVSATTIGRLSQTVRRQRLLLAAATIAALGAGGGLAASTLVQSPAQQASETRPPTPSVLTAPVVRKVLANTVTVRGTVVVSGDITVSPQAAESAGANSAASALLVSKLTSHPGDQIHGGQVLVEVSGRPIIALPGLVPAYRDLKPNMDGDDVAQLQRALIGLGYICGDDTIGHFGPGTKKALSVFYDHLGYAAPTTGGPNDAGDHQSLQGAADAVTTAQRTAATDKSALDKANKALTAVKTAQHTTATSSGTTGGTPSTPPSSNGPGSSTGGGASGGSGGVVQESALQAAQDAVQQAQTAYGYALEDLAKAQKAQADLIATTGIMAPAAELVFVPSFPVRLTAVDATLGQSVSGPLLTLASGQPIVSALLQPGQNGLVKPGMKVQLDAEALGDQTASASVSNVGAFSNGTTVPQSNSTGTKNGAAGGSASGSGVSQQAAPDLPTPSAPGYPMVVTPDKPLSQNWIGQDIRVTIIGASTPGPVISVPLAAVSTGADAQSSVTVVGSDGTQRRVLVTAGVSADGDVEVTPVSPGTLKVGDNVVIGQGTQ